MNLDELSVAVRERTLPELFDLSVQLCRRHAVQLAILSLTGFLPWILLDWLLLKDASDDSWLPLAWLIALLVAQAPIATAPITAFLGEAMFNHRPTMRGAWASTVKRLRALLLVSLMRGAAPLLGVLVFSRAGDGFPGFILLIALIFHPVHAVEVILLERQPIRPSLRRANQLMSSWRSEGVGHLLASACLIVGGCLMAAHAGAEVINLLFWNWIDLSEWERWFHPGVSLVALLLPWPFIAYLAVVRFLAYIDLRTRREGWEIELDLRRAGRRLEPVSE